MVSRYSQFRNQLLTISKSIEYNSCNTNIDKIIYIYDTTTEQYDYSITLPYPIDYTNYINKNVSKEHLLQIITTI